MPAACGIACEVCILKVKGVCPGCVAGTDPKAPEFVEWLKQIGLSCPMLECAIKNKVDYCLKCPKFPCDIAYQREFPYSKNLLDFFGKWKGAVEEISKEKMEQGKAIVVTAEEIIDFVKEVKEK